ncbi:MAG TPA: aldo/keto reductase [Tepidisphaeraceae bacterium]|jgi:aryl-alcohol dehydrogenase-like predicted oxidoreductase
MQYTQLGRTGLKVSKLCLGTMNYGPLATEAESHQQMDKAHDLGINFFDTADVYGWKKGEGVTEQIMGRWLAQGGGRRERTVLATKVYGDMDFDDKDITMKRGLSAVKIRRACENSLRRLRTDYIDLYQMHHVNRETPWAEIWEAMETLLRQGKIMYVGSSNFAGWHIAQGIETAKRRQLVGLVSEQTKYSLACRWPELEVLPACLSYGVGVIPWSPLESGMLAGALEKADKGRRAQDGVAKRIEKERPRLQKWEDFCREIGEKPADVALAWMLHNPAITAPIIGPRTMEQLIASVRAVEVKLTDEHLKKIDQIWPGPKVDNAEGTADFKKHQAPEAYAW